MDYTKRIGDGKAWLTDAQSYCLSGLRAAYGADRLALLRSLIRLSDGRLDLDRIGIVLTAEDTRELSRFGIECSRTVVRLAEEAVLNRDINHFRALAELDSRTRRVDDNCPPDAVLLRHTTHKSYRLQAQKSSISALLTMPDGAGLMVCMPTGAGKSLLFRSKR